MTKGLDRWYNSLELCVGVSLCENAPHMSKEFSGFAALQKAVTGDFAFKK